MATLYEMQTKLKHYYNLKDEINYVVQYMDTCIDDLRPAVKNNLAAYNVDENSKGNITLTKSLNKLVNQRDTIKGTVIPAISFEISKLKKSIEEEQLKLT